MKKIPCLFQREFIPRASGYGTDAVLTDRVTPGLEFVLRGEAIATRKWDGTACMVRDGQLYKRYDAKHGKAPPEGAIPCDDPDPVTGHWPHWVLVREDDPASKWHWAAWLRDRNCLPKRDTTYELVGPHFAPYEYHPGFDIFHEHGVNVIYFEEATLSFESIGAFLKANSMEGIVFWKDRAPVCKIRRADYELPWGAKKGGG